MKDFKYELYNGMGEPTPEQKRIAAENYRKHRPPPPPMEPPLTDRGIKEMALKGIRRGMSETGKKNR